MGGTSEDKEAEANIEQTKMTPYSYPLLTVIVNQSALWHDTTQCMWPYVLAINGNGRHDALRRGNNSHSLLRKT